MENKLDSLSTKDIKNLMDFLEIIKIDLEGEGEPYIQYIAFDDFPKNLKITDILRYFMLLKDLKVFHYIRDRKYRVPGSKREMEYRIHKIDDFKNFYDEFSSKYKIILKSKSVNRIAPKTLITIDTRGNFYFNGKIINFQTTESIYFKIFKCLYLESNLNDGLCSYEQINQFLEANGEENIKDRKKIAKRINNGVMNLFRFAKGLPRFSPEGKEIIRVSRGQGLKFYNPMI